MFYKNYLYNYHVTECASGDIRLVGGLDIYEGRVEVCSNNYTWGTVCDDAWDIFDARVVCRQLGYPTSNAIAFVSAYFGAGSGSIVMDNVFCVGYESSLFSCTYSSTHDCSHNEDAGVRCSNSTITTTTTSWSTPTPTHTPGKP